jgi:hypothetical protein
MVGRVERRWLIAATAGMELSWRLAWAHWLTAALLSAPYPAFGAAACFLIPALITRVFQGRRSRPIVVIALHLVLFGAAGLMMVHYYHGAGFGLWPLDWLYAAAGRAPAAFWGSVALQIILTMALWIAGLTWARRKPDYRTVCNRFDLGLSLLLTLFFIIFFIRVRFEHLVPDGRALLLAASFLCFGLLALTLARTGGGRARRIAGRAGGMWTVAGIGAGGLLIGGGAVAFFLPQLNTAAEAGVRALKVGGRPLLTVFVAAIRFLYGPRNRPAAPTSTGGPASAPDVPGVMAEPSWLDRIFQVLAWGMLVVVALVGAVVLIWLLSLVIRRLLAPAEAKDETVWRLDWRAWAAPFIAAWRLLTSWTTRPNDPAALYRWLNRWGRTGGRPRQTSETPREYAGRLGRAFPPAASDVRAIVDLLEYQIYGDRNPGPDQWTRARRARRRLAGLKIWPLRLKTRLLR